MKKFLLAAAFVTIGALTQVAGASAGRGEVVFNPQPSPSRGTLVVDLQPSPARGELIFIPY